MTAEPETAQQRKWRLLRERQEAKAADRARQARKGKRRRNHLPSRSRVADVIDGYAGDDLGESPDF